MVYRLLSLLVLSSAFVFVSAQDPAAVDLSFNPSDTGNGVFGVHEIAYDILIPSPDGGIITGIMYWNINGANGTIMKFLGNGSPDPNFQLNVLSPIKCMAVQPDGKIIAGTSYPYFQFLFRLNVDGSFDTTFMTPTGLNGPVKRIYIESNGDIVIGGDFDTIQGQSRPFVARLDANGGLKPDLFFGPGGASSWDVTYRDLIVQSDGIAMLFHTGGVVRFDANGIQMPEYDIPDHFDNDEVSTSNPYALAPHPVEGFYMVCRRPNLLPAPITCLRFLGDGSLDSSFVGYFTGQARTVHPLQSGGVLLSGVITGSLLNNACQGYLVLDSSGNEQNSFPTNFLVDTLDANPYYDIDYVVSCVMPDGRIVLSNYQYTPQNGCPRNKTVRLLPSGEFDPSFRSMTSANGIVECLIQVGDGSMVIGGEFTSYNGQPCRRIIKILEDGSIDPSFQSGKGARVPVHSLFLDSDGSILVGLNRGDLGIYPGYNGSTTSSFIKITSDGSYIQDMISNEPGTAYSRSVYSIHRVEDQKLMITTSLGAFRVLPNGGLDPTYDQGTGPNGSFFDSAIMPAGKYLMAGDFSYYNGSAVGSHLLIVTNTGANAFISDNYSITGAARDLEPLPAGGIMVCGGFMQQFSPLKWALIQLNENGQMTTWSSDFDGTGDACHKVRRLLDGKFLVAGNINSYGSEVRNDMVRMMSNGDIDLVFDPGTGFNEDAGYIHVLDIDPMGRYLVAGDFTEFNSVGRNRIMRLMGDGLITDITAVDHTRPLLTLQDGQFLISDLSIDGPSEIYIHDMMGRMVASLNASVIGNTTSLSVPDLAKGSYVLEIVSLVQQKSHRLRFLLQ